MRKLVYSLQFTVYSTQFTVWKSYWRKLPTFHCLLLTVYCLLIISCSESREQAIPVITDFEIQVVDNDYSVPVQVRITNTTEGADTYNWAFTGASPTSSTDRNPGTITYTEAGDYTIRLDASNQDESTDSKEITISIDAEVVIGFTKEILVDNFPPMEVALTNTTIGADNYSWTFQNGSPTSSTNQHPNNVIFNDPGEHTITLEVSNGLETYQTEQTVTVAPHLVAAFDYEVAFEDDDFQAPVTLTMINNSISATDYTWTFTGGTPSTSTEENPTVTFNSAGTYTLELEATNGKETLSTSQNITVVVNTNIRTFQDIQLGINTAHNNNTIGTFFSTTTRKVYKKEDVTADNGAAIDIAFFGLNQSFTFNKFVSPDEVQTLTFDAIPNATYTKFINLQESCGCPASMSLAEFDAMTDDTLLEALTITETTEGLQDFDNTIVPRIVLFETQDGRKGAIKIKNFVVDGDNSYIVIDIKVMKQ
ncbi:PKD domain-containing protein [uncultured Polaribacter sp.]|uniref:PKD domain-containing protein n=1 Tax=uncultured Polaribacter sp. TaxID=174711 RepID=UPI002634CF00|nr:PKD domain-containing protein [uncultured Polaribacter sp.]